MLQAPPVTALEIRAELEKVLSSSLFRSADRSRVLLKFVVDEAVAGNTERLKEYTLGTEALGRPESFDPRFDPIVRAEASRLRTRLEHYYASEGRTDSIEITLPKGAYVPVFSPRASEAQLADAFESSRRPEARPGPFRWVSIAAVSLGLLVAVWAVAVWGLRFRNSGTPPSHATQFEIPSAPDTVFAPPISRQPFAISPDGTRLAFTVAGRDGTSIYLRELAALDLHEVPNSHGVWGVFWAPDSRSLYFSVGTTLKQYILESGSTRDIAKLPYHVVTGVWRTESELLLFLGDQNIYAFHVETGLVSKPREIGFRWAQFLPGTDSFVHAVYSPELGTYQINVTDYSTQRSKPILAADSHAQYAPPRHSGEPGYLVFLRAGTLLAQAFDAAHLRLQGDPFPVAQNVIYFAPSASACFSLSSSGTLVYQAGFPLSALRWYDRAGRVVDEAAQPASFNGTVRISPDGRHVAATIWDPQKGAADIWLYDRSGRESRRLTYSAEAHYRPTWSPEGGRVAFSSSRTAGPSLATIEAAEGGREQQMHTGLRIPEPGEFHLPTDWSSDDRWIAYDTSLGGEQGAEAWLMEVANPRAFPLVAGGTSQWGVVFSRDNKRVAFVSRQSGRPEVYVQGFEALPSPHLIGERKQVSRNGAWFVRWRPDNHELFFAGTDSKLYAVPMKAGLPAGEPQALFVLPGSPRFDTPTDFQFDVEADGQRFVMTTAASAIPPPYTVIQNWQDKFRHQP